MKASGTESTNLASFLSAALKTNPNKHLFMEVYLCHPSKRDAWEDKAEKLPFMVSNTMKS